MQDSFVFRVAGISHYQYAASRCRTGDAVVLMPEPENHFDPNAIRVEVNGEQIGYVPKEMTHELYDVTLFTPGAAACVLRVLGGDSGYLIGVEVEVPYQRLDR
jgi:hypothetical protein